ncbi:MAG: hypothetical protein EOP04_00295 [Proteobacteria bacterium]|nr:MAG: hypothetical protein EOP04_00295 [Pseudomonadota bacterium]
MNLTYSNMNSSRFELVASKCKWSDRSLEVARLLIVQNKSLSESAATYQMSPQQAYMIRKRFLAMADKVRIEEFMNREKPKRAKSAISPFSLHVQLLWDKGYSIVQIVAFLEEHGVSTSPANVRNFLRNPQQ